MRNAVFLSLLLLPACGGGGTSPDPDRTETAYQLCGFDWAGIWVPGLARYVRYEDGLIVEVWAEDDFGNVTDDDGEGMWLGAYYARSGGEEGDPCTDYEDGMPYFDYPTGSVVTP